MGIMNSNRTSVLVLSGILALAAPGCATLNGHWSGSELTPAMARDQYDLFRPANAKTNFVSADLRLQQDGTFLADLKYGTELVQTAGTWKLDGAKLTLTDRTGRAQVFLTKRIDDNTLQLITGIKGSDVVLVIKKQV